MGTGDDVRTVTHHPASGLKWFEDPADLTRETEATYAVANCLPRDREAGVPGLPVFTVMRNLFAARSSAVTYLQGLAERIENLVFARIQSDPDLKLWLCQTSFLQGHSEHTRGALIFPLVKVDILTEPLVRILDAQLGAPIVLLVLQAPAGGLNFFSPGFTASRVKLYAGDAVLLGPFQDEMMQNHPQGLVARYHVPAIEGVEAAAPLSFTISRSTAKPPAPITQQTDGNPLSRFVTPTDQAPSSQGPSSSRS